ncbi:MAG TPA: hypothetical protein VGF45_06730 [Polyangia bacterium]
MTGRRISPWVWLLACLVLLCAAGARSPAAKAPWFSLEATSGGVRTPASFAGRVVLLMYEDRDSGELNAALKAEVKRRMENEPAARTLVVLPVADVRKYNYFPARGIVRRAVVERAETLGTDILLDWTGDIARAYGFVAPGSNVVLIGRDGVHLYQRTSPLDATERRRFHAVLSTALASAKARQATTFVPSEALLPHSSRTEGTP